ncbi:DUF4760 domain-containing protein [Actinokineospora terrae]|uniref:DUF4760 domain-containing protein n=1 Tax=Actinokineospora terrae TaxID=155974 RepID=UPI0015A542FD|nr:hypothetical protein [Actinokineospora terrae]
MPINIVAICLSGIALIASTILATQQRNLQRRSTFLPAYVLLLNEFRSGDFHDNYAFICSKLRQEYDAELGISGLPKEVRDAVYSVAYFYQGLAVLRGTKILDPELLSSVNYRAVKLWQAIEVFVKAERELLGADSISPFRTLEKYVSETQARGRRRPKYSDLDTL